MGPLQVDPDALDAAGQALSALIARVDGIQFEATGSLGLVNATCDGSPIPEAIERLQAAVTAFAGWASGMVGALSTAAGDAAATYRQADTPVLSPSLPSAIPPPQPSPEPQPGG